MADTGEVIWRGVLRNTAANYAGKALMMGIGFLLTPFILARIGASAYGIWALAAGVIGYGSLLDLGISGAVIKYVAAYEAQGEHDEASLLASTALALYAGLGVVALLLSVGGAFVFPLFFRIPAGEHRTATLTILFMGCSLALGLIGTVPAAVLRAFHRFDLVNLLLVLGTAAGAAATVLVLLLGGGLVGMVGVGALVALSMLLPSLWAVRRVAPHLTLAPALVTRSLLRPIASYSLSTFMLQFGGQLQTETDSIVIAAALPVRAVTPYSIALRLSVVPQVLTDQFMKVLLPLASRLHAHDDAARLRELYLTSTRLTLAVLLPIGAAVTVLSGPLLSAWVGRTYAQYAPLVVVLTVASVVVTSQWPAGSVLQGMARHRVVAWSGFASGVLNLALSVVLVRPYGLTGVAVATLIPTVAESLLVVLPYSVRALDLSYRRVLMQAFLPPLLPLPPMVLALLVLRLSVAPLSLVTVALVACLGAVIYLGGYLAFGARGIERALWGRLLARALPAFSR